MGLSRYRTVLAVWLAACLYPCAARATEAEAAPRQQPYAGKEATGPHVLALWQFDGDEPLKDVSGHGHDLTLRGRTKIVKDGRFGAGLRCLPADTDKAEGARVAKRSADLSPKGAFTIESWFRPTAAMADRSSAFLLDCKYYPYPKDLPQANTGYMLYLRRQGEQWRPVAMLGYGKDSAEFLARPVALTTGQWYHIAFAYDGQGSGRILLDGEDIGGADYAGRGSIAPARYALTLGDRYGSTHAGSGVTIDQVRITRGVTFGGLAVEIGTACGRKAFRRMEKDVHLEVRVRNRAGRDLPAGQVRIRFDGERRAAIPALKPRQMHRIALPLDTSRKPGAYRLEAQAVVGSGAEAIRATRSVDIHIVPRPLPNVMPVILWGTGDFERLKRIGFTHHFVSLADLAGVWRTGRALPPHEYANLDAIREKLDAHLVEGIGVIAHVSPARYLRDDLAYRRIDANGKPRPKGVCASFPRIQQYGYDTGVSVARAFGRYPAFQAALIHTEVRGSTNLCYHARDQQACRKATGRPQPKDIRSKWGLEWAKIPGFPKDRVLADDDARLAFYRWFWRDGDGWNPLHTQVHRGLMTMGRGDFWTFYDPAVRVPPLWGSGGQVSVISHWTYSYPDPIKIAQCADELFAMAAGRPGQQVMKMTQIIWYRNQTAPAGKADDPARTDWEKRLPDARFITIAPDHLREAFWSKISRPIRGIMYHGWGSLVDGVTHGAYRYTNPDTQNVLAELTRTVVKPLGPTLLQVPDPPADVGVLESFAACMFARRGTWGWSQKWPADAHLVLQWAQLQPKILFDETVMRDGLADLRVLVVPHGDVLTRGVVDRIRAWQKAGGILVADEHLAPALEPDIVLPAYKRTGEADVDKAALQARAADLRKALDSRYTRYAESDNPDVVVRCRRWKGSDYLFAVNDKRTFGEYVGRHGKVMAKGVPASARLTVRSAAEAVYDMVRHKAVAFRKTDTGIQFTAELGGGDGRVWLIANQAIHSLALRAPKQAKLTGRVHVELAVRDAEGKPIGAVVPVRLEVLDPASAPAEGTGYYGAAGGTLAVDLDLAPNDLPGEWTIRATELASGLTRSVSLTVTR